MEKTGAKKPIQKNLSTKAIADAFERMYATKAEVDNLNDRVQKIKKIVDNLKKGKKSW